MLTSFQTLINMNILVNSEYTSIACNRTVTIADWNSDGIICYGACNAIIINDPKTKGPDPLTVLSHHNARINSVKWLVSIFGSSTEFLSCSNDKRGTIWSNVGGLWKVTSDLVGHTEGVTSIDGVYTNKNDLVAFTASIDSSIKIWVRGKGETSCLQTISLQSGLCLTLKAHRLPKYQKPILFCALDDHKIHIFGNISLVNSEYLRLHMLSGHEDWVRGLDVMDIGSEGILLASSSQDTYIRLWRIQHFNVDEAPSTGIKIEEKIFKACDQDWSVKLDAVLAGHEGWVYGVQWHPPTFDPVTNTYTPVYRLLSSSLDKTLIIWEPESDKQDDGKSDAGVWVERVRVGEVGGNGLGFYGSKFGPNGKSFLGHGYNGSFHVWKFNEELQIWEPAVVCGGHFAEVCDVRWEPTGKYIASVSTDQTTRVHAPWSKGDITEWHEISRPQVHGYDMSSIALISSTSFVSAAEEKVIRVFEAPQSFVHNFKNITRHDLGISSYCNGNGPEGASVPSLGLSNKAVYSGDHTPDSKQADYDQQFIPSTLTEPPTEEALLQNTLWPEVHKLYGHGYEVFSLDASADGMLVASACKATTAEHAAVIVWETGSWQQIQKLTSHTLTVTQLAFSPNSQLLLSVSRDRKWTLYQRVDGVNTFDLVATTDKSNGVHTRIIWCCAWSHDSSIFGTGSRDGKLCLWKKTDTIADSSLKQYSICGKPLDTTHLSITTLAFAPAIIKNKDESYNLLSVGYDNGCIRLYSFLEKVDNCWSLLRELDNSSAHHLTVKRLTFRPTMAAEDGSELYEFKLASCGSDHLVRIYNINVNF